jgi:putative ABC transport system ATP-binding protein
MIKLNNLQKTYITGPVKTHVLKGISFKVNSGEFVAIKGPSGSGKSTLMHIMSLLDRPTGGSYFFEEENVNSFSDEKLARMRNKKMGFIFQSFNLMKRMTVFENVRLPLLYNEKDIPDKKEEKLTSEVIKQVGLSHRKNYYPNQLSGGEQQRVAIARALVNNPSIIFADEPTGNLDSKTGKTIMMLLQELNEKGNTIIMVTHEKYTSQHAKRIIELKDGKIVNDQKVKERLIAKNENSLLK